MGDAILDIFSPENSNSRILFNIIVENSVQNPGRIAVTSS